MATELKPCPFCGRKPSKVREYKIESISDTFYTVECKAKGSKCAVNPKTRFHCTAEKAIEAWNRRADE